MRARSTYMRWHDGEEKMHHIMKVSGQMNPTSPFLTPGAAYMVYQSPLIALGALDDQKRPWTTIWGGEPGFAGPTGKSMIGIDSLVDTKHDPVLQALLRDEKAVEYEKKGPVMAGLSIDLESRTRVKLHGRIKAGVVDSKEARAQLLMKIDASLPNCPKYLNEKYIVPATPTPKLISDSPRLSPEAVALLGKADLFFISSSYRNKNMDTNHRGGPKGFVRMISNNSTGAVIVYPEYSGNRLYQTLGNLQETPLVGLAVPDFDTGDVLHLTGKTNVLIGEEADRVLPRCKLAVQITVSSARFVRTGLSFKAIAGEESPYNPPVRYVRGEKDHEGIDLAQNKDSQRAFLVDSEYITPTIKRFRFRLKDASNFKAWKPGQYATLSFEEYLDQGWSHMRDEDPRSLNDDYLRTFTVSSPPTQEAVQNGEFEMIIRNVGKATAYLFEQEADGGCSLPFRGFGGEFRFNSKHQRIAFIAAGIGITPVLSQLSSMSREDIQRFHLLWAIRMEDIGLVSTTLRQYPELMKSTKLFLTGEEPLIRDNQQARKTLDLLLQSTVHIERRRLEESDLSLLKAETDIEWYMCVGPAMKGHVLNWLAGTRVIYEDFNY
ncbi:oxidoreductase [Paecilomyces variotii No. 5]|uniref:Oxidoreductase n=1 Tax=Byssochlamys spectabilis (strain No. 5 / NBRC 109023) TaxID=1356009 RepID=V5FUG6_BYSSN|nr:oxidoreductase [Paecilomyces variotii No. 5]